VITERPEKLSQGERRWAAVSGTVFLALGLVISFGPMLNWMLRGVQSLDDFERIHQSSVSTHSHLVLLGLGILLLFYAINGLRIGSVKVSLSDRAVSVDYAKEVLDDAKRVEDTDQRQEAMSTEPPDVDDFSAEHVADGFSLYQAPRVPLSVISKAIEKLDRADRKNIRVESIQLALRKEEGNLKKWIVKFVDRPPIWVKF
jgi:hypothetical protein